MMRRNLYLEGVTPKGGARNQIKRLQPTDKFLFGEGVGSIAKAVKHAADLNPLSRFDGESYIFVPWIFWI